MEVESREVTVTRKYLTIDGREFSATVFFDIVEKLETTQPFFRTLVPNTQSESDILDFLTEKGIAERRVGGDYYCADEDARKELFDEFLEEYYE